MEESTVSFHGPEDWTGPDPEGMLRFAQFAVDHAAEAIFWARPGGRFFYVNNEACRSLGYSREELLNLSVTDINPTFDTHLFCEFSGQLEAAGSLTFETDHCTKDGRLFPVEVTVSSLDFQGERYLVAFVRDISERKKAEETIHRMAYRDRLTDLPNRALFDDRLYTALAHAERYQRKLGIMLLDLYDFKRVNDTLGHDFGDSVLRAVSQRLSSIVRSSDTLARWGGDEFVLAVDIVQDDDAASVASKLLDTLEMPFTVEGRELTIGASLGIATYPSHAQDGPALIRCADIAMYKAKKQGRNTFAFYDPANP